MLKLFLIVMCCIAALRAAGQERTKLESNNTVVISNGRKDDNGKKDGGESDGDSILQDDAIDISPYWYSRHGVNHNAAPCHNSSGTCFSNGTFICMNLEHVPHSARCDGNIDCEDSTDELWCERPPIPWYAHNTTEREMAVQFSMSTCIGCNCPFGPPTGMLLTQSHPWFAEALHAKPEGTFANTVSPFSRGCNPDRTSAMLLLLFKKTKLCRMAVCCAMQKDCLGCTDNLVFRSNKCWP